MGCIKIPVIALSGSVGVGKTSTLIEIHDVLEKREIPHGCVERDALGYSWPAQGRFNEGLIELNLSCVVGTFLAAGAERLVIAGVIETPDDLSVYHRCIPNAEIQVCRLTAELDLRRERLRTREKGAGLEWHLDRTVELDGILDRAQVGHFIVDNGNRPLRDVALEVLARAGWLPNPQCANSTWSSGTIRLGTPLANGASSNIRMLFGIQQTGNFKFYVNIEALP